MPRRTAKGETVTLQDVARAAGVSMATVSRVVNGSRRVAPDLRVRVEREVNRLGYVANHAARGLATGRSGSIAVVIQRPRPHVFENPVFPSLLSGIERALDPAGVQAILLLPESEAEEARVARYLGGGPVDGALVTAIHPDDALPAALLRRGVPIVLLGRPPDDLDVTSVVVDNRAASRAATTHLLAIGRRSLGHVAGPVGMRTTADRIAGFRDALEERGLASDATRIEHGHFTPHGGAAAAVALLERIPDLDGLVVASDWMAVAAIDALARRGRRVPDDVAVVGFDDVPIAFPGSLPLTTIRQPLEEFGAEAARLLLAQIAGERTPRQVVFPTELVIRASTIPPPAGELDHEGVRTGDGGGIPGPASAR